MKSGKAMLFSGTQVPPSIVGRGMEPASSPAPRFWPKMESRPLAATGLWKLPKFTAPVWLGTGRSAAEGGGGGRATRECILGNGGDGPTESSVGATGRNQLRVQHRSIRDKVLAFGTGG